MSWIAALKIFNEGKPSWCVPRKDTPDYNEVARIRKHSSPEEVAKRNAERKAKAEEQLKAIDTRAKIEARREAEKPKEVKKRTAAQRNALSKNYPYTSTQYIDDHPNLSVIADYWEGHIAYQVYDTNVGHRGVRGRTGLAAVFPIEYGEFTPSRGKVPTWELHRAPPSFQAWVRKQPDWDEWAATKE